ncbi:MAG: hypothetical protein LWY06_18840 [Firmicutes bacterium]|nr:hypothetical protein [Bacillota bacterium]
MISITILLLLAASFLLLTAVCCDFFSVYIPGITMIIPAQYRQADASAAEIQQQKVDSGKEVVIVEKGSLSKDKNNQSK